MAVRDDWHSLCRRAAVANVFMDPAVALAVSATDTSPVRVLLVWARAMPEEETQLVGAWLGSVRTTRQSWPFKCFLSPTISVAYLGTPVVDKAFAEPAFQNLLRAIRRHGQLPGLIALNDFNKSLLPPLSEALAQCGMKWIIVETKRRARLLPCADPTAFWASTRSKAHLSNFRRLRRQLKELGKFECTLSDDPKDISADLEEFLALEKSGWKGKRQTALASSMQTSSFTRTMIVHLAARGLVKLHSLRLNGKAIAMSIVLCSGSEAFTWRMAVDESFHRYSPGILLLEDVTMDLLRDPSVTTVDSCNDGDAGYQAERWPDRHELVDLLISTNPIWMQVRLLATRERSIRQLRRFAGHALRTVLNRARAVGKYARRPRLG